jgi:hypothetical protein
MTPAEIVGSLRRRGIVVAPSGDGRLRYRPRRALSEVDREVLTRHRDAILALLDADPVGWRAAVMAGQVRQNAAIPLLLARPDAPKRPGRCYSCGGQLSRGERYRCRLCVAATVRVLAVVRAAGAPS